MRPRPRCRPQPGLHPSPHSPIPRQPLLQLPPLMPRGPTVEHGRRPGEALRNRCRKAQCGNAYPVPLSRFKARVQRRECRRRQSPRSPRVRRHVSRFARGQPRRRRLQRRCRRLPLRLRFPRMGRRQTGRHSLGCRWYHRCPHRSYCRRRLQSRRQAPPTRYRCHRRRHCRCQRPCPQRQRRTGPSRRRLVNLQSRNIQVLRSMRCRANRPTLPGERRIPAAAVPCGRSKRQQRQLPNQRHNRGGLSLRSRLLCHLQSEEAACRHQRAGRGRSRRRPSIHRRCRQIFRPCRRVLPPPLPSLPATCRRRGQHLPRRLQRRFLRRNRQHRTGCIRRAWGKAASRRRYADTSKPMIRRGRRPIPSVRDRYPSSPERGRTSRRCRRRR